MQEEIKEIRKDVKHLVSEMSEFKIQHAILVQIQDRHDKNWSRIGDSVKVIAIFLLGLVGFKIKR